MIKIAIADDHTLFRKSLALLINSFGSAVVVLEASNGQELMELLETISVDIVLLDLQMPVMDGYDTCSLLHKKYSEVKVLVLSHLDSIETISRVMELGVDGYFTKSADPSELKTAILNLHEKGFYFEKSLEHIISEINAERFYKTKESKIITITDREKEIIALAIKELSGKEIADKLNISVRTVEVHKKNLMEKTASRNFLGVILYALINEYLQLDKLR